MDARTLLNLICDESDKGKECNIEFPGLCGNSDVGKTRCKNAHGHLALSVSQATVSDVAFKETHSMVLITIPKTILNKIMGSNNG